MLPDRDHLKHMLDSLDVAIAGAAKHHPDEADFRTTLRASIRLLMLESNEADHEWIRGQIEEMLARHGLKDFEL
jgi:hypothetical protein